MGTDCNFFNMGTIVYVVVAGGPVLKGIQRYRVDLIPSTVLMYNVKKGFETIGPSTCWTSDKALMQEKDRTTRAAH